MSIYKHSKKSKNFKCQKLHLQYNFWGNEKTSGCWSDIYSKERIESRHQECIYSFQNVSIFQKTWRNFLILYHNLEIPTVIATAMSKKLNTLFYEHSWSSSLCIESEKTVMGLLYYWKNFIVNMSCVPLHLLFIES